MAGAHRQSCRSGRDAIRISGRARPGRRLFCFCAIDGTDPKRCQAETTMTIRIGTATTLKDFIRRDFLVSSALTAALFTAALLLFPAGAKIERKDPTVAGSVSLHASMPRR
jgi:nitrate/nitrite transport system substrate-binding protein